MTTPMTPQDALFRLQQYGKRTSTWSTATYNDGTEKALHQIATALGAEAVSLGLQVDRLNAEGAQLRDRLAELEALELGAVDGRVSAACGTPGHPTWLRSPDDTRGCPWCRVTDLETERHTTNAALSDAAEALRRDRDRIAELEASPPFADNTGEPVLAAFAQAVHSESLDYAVKYGHLRRSDGTTPSAETTRIAELQYEIVQLLDNAGTVTWTDVLKMMTSSIQAEADPAQLRGHLLRTAVLCASWTRDISQRHDSALPHDPYITAVVDALTTAGLEPTTHWTSDLELDPYDDGPHAGCTTMLNAYLDWNGTETAAHEHGFALLWDHPAEQWQWAPRAENGHLDSAPEFLPKLGRYAHPDAVVATVRALTTGEPLPEGHAPYWHEADAVKTAVAAWAAES
ncbi:hypothetical protein ACFXHD_09880 [Streptomyces hydrogenans]|uniref:hypothetical protein n=1 Tax=Streptomyces hydrogenans TaxID=1873719 RepID=UPI0036BBCE98